MHEITVAIKKLWPPFKAGDKRTTLEDSDGNKYRIDADYAGGFHDGDVVTIGWTDEKAPAEFGGKEYKLIKKMKHVEGGVRGSEVTLVNQPPPKPADVGPHLGMWEKRASQLLEGGMPEEAVIVHIILCRRLARAGLQTDIDGKLPELKARAEYDDDIPL